MLAFALGISLIGGLISSEVGNTNKKNAISRSQYADRDRLYRKGVEEKKYFDSQRDINTYRQSIRGSGIANPQLGQAFGNEKYGELFSAQNTRYAQMEEVYEGRYKALSDSLHEDILAQIFQAPLKLAKGLSQIQQVNSYIDKTRDYSGSNLLSSQSTGDILNSIDGEIDKINNIRLDNYYTRK